MSNGNGPPADCPIVAADLVDKTTHGDLLEKIGEIEMRLEESIEGLRHELFWAAVKGAGILVPVAVAILLWVWSVIKDQAALNGELQARMEAQGAAAAEARASSVRIEERLAEINRYIREDSRELRDALTRHIDGVRVTGGE